MNRYGIFNKYIHNLYCDVILSLYDGSKMVFDQNTISKQNMFQMQIFPRFRYSWARE